MIKKLLFIWLSISFAGSVAYGQTIQDYVEEHTEYAQDLSREYDIPASIILGVAIHESAAGKSKIARYLNNHFGIKGPNSSTAIRSAYRGYDDVYDSYDHFIKVLKARKSFSKLFDEYDPDDYKNWARGIQRGGYASSRTWASQVIAIINRYELYEYDQPTSAEDIADQSDVAAIEAEAVLLASTAGPAKAAKRSVYVVKRGDSLNKIAKKYGTTAVSLMRKNRLDSSLLQPGQKIKL